MQSRALRRGEWQVPLARSIEEFVPSREVPEKKCKRPPMKRWHEDSPHAMAHKSYGFLQINWQQRKYQLVDLVADHISMFKHVVVVKLQACCRSQ